MRILHLISQTPDFTGSGKFIQQIITQAGARGHENFLVAGAQKAFSPEPGLIHPDRALFVRFDGADLPFPVAGMSDAMPYKSTVFSRMTQDDLDLYKRVFRRVVEEAVERFRPDLIHSHHLWILSALAREVTAQKDLEIPMVTTCHGTCLRQHLLCPAISKEITPHLKGISQVMALNPSQQQEIMDRFGFGQEAVPVMAGGYDDQVFMPGEKPESGPVELVYAGKLCRAKGVPWLLKSLLALSDKGGPEFRLHLAGGGSGDEKAACLDLARRLGDRAVVHGPLSHIDLAALMGRSHLFVLPSFFEGVPLVLMEALACGCRVLATDLPGVREILPDLELSEMVRLLPLPPLETIDRPFAGDEAALERKLSAMLGGFMSEIRENPLPDLDLAGQITRPYSWEKVFDRIDRVYETAATPAG